ncbi:MAG TPA: hypothetical protein PLB32_18250, partial [Acidobacteriota bacterium]|nr:hypothetical protein [Acidobacteriota bacterium]
MTGNGRVRNHENQSGSSCYGSNCISRHAGCQYRGCLAACTNGNVFTGVRLASPDDTEAHMKLTGLYWRFGMFEAAKHEQKKYNS